jgi:hypothetical protein
VKRRTLRYLTIGSIAAGLGIAGTLVANAQWIIPGQGTVRITTAVLPAGSIPHTKRDGANITVSWAGQVIAPGVPMQKYVVTGHDAQSPPRPDVTRTVAATTATFTLAELGVGKWSWAIAPKYELWSGAEGSRSTPPVTVEGSPGQSTALLAAPAPAAGALGKPASERPVATATTTPAAAPMTVPTTEAPAKRPEPDPTTSAPAKDPEPEKTESPKAEPIDTDTPSETDSAAVS